MKNNDIEKVITNFSEFGDASSEHSLNQNEEDVTIMEDSASVSEFGGDLMDGMLDLEIKPFVSQQIHIVKKWWTEINPNEDANIPNEKVYRFFIAKKISQD